MKYYSIDFKLSPCNEALCDVLSGEIAALGFESYEYGEDGIVGYIPCNLFDKDELDNTLAAFPIEGVQIEYTQTEAPDENWNALWESQFTPIVVDGKCTIKASFHEGLKKTRYNITIDPKMAFGTGHHQTTFMMCRALLQNEEAVRGKVGDNDGIKEYMFTNNVYGGGLQYGYCDNVELLADLGFVIRKTEVVSQPRLPKKEGSTNKKEITADIKFLFGENKSDNLWIKGCYGKTGGTEYIQKLTVESATDQYWNVISSNVMSSYKNMTASLGYDHQFGASDARGYDWIVGGQADFLMRKDTYNLPVSTFKATTVAADVFGGKQFKFKSSSLLVKVDGGYGMSLGSEYFYGGTNPNTESVNMYKVESEYFNTDYAKAGCSVAYTFNTKRLGFVINAAADYIKPLGIAGHRLYANTSFGILF